LAFLKLPLTTKIYKLVLTNMDEKILPFFTKPVLLMDFLKHSYDVGGIISILALNGLFILVAKHNL
jgi:U3 small nucleolar RNA-associated protein 19